MARNKNAGHGKDTYRTPHEIAYDKAYNARKDKRDHRNELNKANRADGTYGKMTEMGMDRSHTKSGGLVLEKSSTNRGRNGKDGKSTKK